MRATRSAHILMRPVEWSAARPHTPKNISALLMLPILTAMSIQPWSKVAVGNKTFWLTISIFILLYCFVVAATIKGGRSAAEMKWLKVYLLYNVLSILYGALVAESYWDWKNLVDNGLVLLIPIAVYLAFRESLLKYILQGYITFVIPTFLLYLPFMTSDGFGLYLALVPIFLLAVPFLSQRWRLLLLLLAITVIISDPSARSNVIRFAIAIIFLGFYCIPKNIAISIMKLSHILFFVVPIILFFLAASGTFNVFNIDDYIKGTIVNAGTDRYGATVEEDLTADTRTELYMEVLESAKEHDSWWFGRSPALGHDTKLFSEEAFIATGRNERSLDEVGILNIFTWTGIVGVVSYTAVLFFATSVAIRRSSNMFCRIIGLFISFRWAYSWVEEMNTFSLNYFGIWLATGICLSTALRSMNDAQFRQWIRDVFYLNWLWSKHA